MRIPKTLTGTAIDEIKRQIITGELRFGEQIVESELAARFGLSKTPVREALLALQKEDLVVILPRKGTFVFAPTVRELERLMETRQLIEVGALRQAMKRNSIRLLKEMGELLEESYILLDKSGGSIRGADVELYLRTDTDLHQLFFTHTDNPFLISFYYRIAAQLSAVRYRLSFERSFVHRSIIEHREFFGDLKAGRIDEACRNLEAHIGRCFTPDNIGRLASEGSGTCV